MLQIRTFGGVAIRLDDVEVHFDAHSAEALLVYLACQGQPRGRDALAELLWPERTQEQARSNLRVAVHRLRQQLDPYLLVTRQNIALHPNAVIQLDCALFEAHLTAEQLANATALYAGDFLADFYLDGSPAFEQWALLERERLRTLAIAAYQQLIGQTATAGQRDTAIASAQRLLLLDPLHEPTHRQLMRLLAQAGQRSAALTQYAICCQVLDAELGVPPDDTTTALYEQIRAGNLRSVNDEGRALETDGLDGVTRPSTRVDRHNLPPQPTPFIGREAELAQIDALLANPDCRLLSLLGVGGIGKTRLAIEAAAQQLDNFVDGVAFVPLASVGTPEFLVTAIAHGLNITLDNQDTLAQVMQYLRPRQLLLVLDNFEHLVDVSEVVATLLRHAPQLKVVVTTRVRLQLLEEWLLAIDGLPVGDTVLGSAAQLFLRSAQRVQPTFTAAGQGETILSICRQVGGMPLAIELAASWARLMSCAEIALQLAQSFDMLSTSVRNIPERHRSIRALLDQSWRLLAPLEQTVLMHLSVFQGGWTLDEAAPVAGATPALVLALADNSLVRSNGSNRYDMHELVRQYAAERLADSGEMEMTRQRHFAAYLALARAADRKLRGPEATQWFNRLEEEQGNLHAALYWASDSRRSVELAWLGLALMWFWVCRVRWSEAVTWLEPTLADAHAWPVDLRLANLLNLYNFWVGTYDHQATDFYANELMHLARTCNNKTLHATALFMMAVSAADVSQAASAYADALSLARQSEGSDTVAAEFCLFSDTDFLLANLLYRYGTVLRSRGDYAQAAACYQESLALLRAKGDSDTIAYPLGYLGRLALIHGDVTRAQQLIGEAVTIAHTLGSAKSITDWQPYLGLVRLYQGDSDEAWRLLQTTLTFCNEMKNVQQSRKTNAILAMVALQRGALDDADHSLRDSLAGYRPERWVRPELVDGLFTAVRLAAAQQHFERAAVICGLAERLRAEIHHLLDQPVRPLVEAALEQVRKALGPVGFAAAWEQGQALSLDEGFVQLLASHGLTNNVTSL